MSPGVAHAPPWRARDNASGSVLSAESAAKTVAEALEGIAKR